MSYFKANMNHIRFPLGLRPRSRWESYSTPPDHMLYLRGLFLRGGRESGAGKEVRKEM